MGRDGDTALGGDTARGGGGWYWVRGKRSEDQRGTASRLRVVLSQ